MRLLLWVMQVILQVYVQGAPVIVGRGQVDGRAEPEELRGQRQQSHLQRAILGVICVRTRAREKAEGNQRPKLPRGSDVAESCGQAVTMLLGLERISLDPRRCRGMMQWAMVSRRRTGTVRGFTSCHA